MSAWYALICRAHGTEHLDLSQTADVALLSALGTWRYTQGIYRFHPEFYNALLATLPNAELPVDVLYRLPEWCVYLETPGAKWFSTQLFGFWSHLEWDANTERHELRLLLNTENALIPIILHLGKWTVSEAVERAIAEAKHQAELHKLDTLDLSGTTKDISQNLAILSLLLYLCSNEPEIIDERRPQDRPERPHPKRIKKGPRLFAPEKPRIWTVGAGTGAKLACAQVEASTRTSVAPHLRRAHWHGYWTGARAADREFVYKWLSPIFVAGAKEPQPAPGELAINTQSSEN
jgi:hypothetical protein